MDRDTQPAAHPVVVLDDGSPWGEAAVRWASAHAALLDAPLEKQPPTEDQLHDLLLVSARAEALVVGHRGADGNSFGLGRLVLPLVRHAACDVIVVRGTPEALRGGHRRVTALITGDERDALVLHRAVDLAERKGAALRVLHAAPDLPVRADQPGLPVTKADRVLHDIRHTSVLARMHPHEAVARYADTDLFVLADRGPVTRAPLYHAHSPVLVAHQVPTEAHHGPELRTAGIQRAG
ncbi:hypothetical protein FHX81_1238 [Saccharothrix saharensis]|uniref:Universal stress protein family protein n=1 Tax=Saccharothrix saharensis TaxID=571190 RepID=A0A543J7Z5_9PSEU|nr:universal stress protein [Saccharothrix saharensis]TQM78949.1 hypothetical protein FHX81_1238 [Saccharothrix saharensis]